MRKIFKIVEKIVWALVIIAIIIVFVLVAIGIIAKADNVWDRINPYIPYLYLIAAIFVAFKGVILIVQMHYESKIENGTMHLHAIIEKQQAQIIVQENLISGKLDKIINDIATIPNVDSSAILNHISSNLPKAFTELVNQRVALERQQLELEYQKKFAELNERALTVDAVLKNHDRLESIKAAIALKEEEERAVRLKNTEEYTMLVFSLAKTPVEDVEKVCQVTKLFIESGHVVADKQFKIAHNKKLRNAELWHFAKNIVKYNQKENLDVESYLMITFEDWFKGSKDNFARNYSDLPKNSLVSKDGVEADLERLRSKLSVGLAGSTE